jgi:hypothetical protein
MNVKKEHWKKDKGAHIVVKVRVETCHIIR